MFVKFFPIQTGEPFGLPLSFTLLAIFSLALIVAALLLDSGLNLLNQWQIEQANTNDTIKEAGYPKHRHTGKVAIATLVLSAILLARALYYFYWFMIWDTTYDGLGYLWLPIPFLAILSSTFILSITLPENIKLAALFYLLLIPAMIVISTRIQRMDFRQLTKERAERVNQAIENYYIQEGRYPNNLQDLTLWFIPIIPGPVIIYGQEWCYDGGDHYYRLGYIDREHWSAPHFIGRIYRANGDIPDLPGICEQEAAALQQRHPDFPYEYWVEGE